MKLLTRTALFLGRILCRFRSASVVNYFAKLSLEFSRGLNNVDFDMHRNGELRMLKILKDHRVHVVFDVGANVGEWSLLAAQAYEGASIHAFEIMPSTYQILLEHCASCERIQCARLGLSDTAGYIEMHYGEASVVTSAYKIKGMKQHDEYYQSSMLCATTTGSAYLRETGIDQVDLLKIDVEGMDLKVIRGFGERIRDVRVIQFEYGIFNIGSHDLLYDFWVHLEKHGFKVGKLFPTYVDFVGYHFDLDNFHGSNYLAVREDEAALLEALSGHSK